MEKFGIWLQTHYIVKKSSHIVNFAHEEHYGTFDMNSQPACLPSMPYTLSKDYINIIINENYVQQLQGWFGVIEGDQKQSIMNFSSFHCT